MKFWLDLEFQEDGRTIEPISIGLVAEDGRTFYREFKEYDKTKATPWLKENVLPLLGGGVMPKESIRQDLVDFCGDWPEIWGWYGAYDWVALCQIFGTMMDLPMNWPMFIREAMMYRGPRDVLPKRTTPEHHALHDAEWQREVYYFLLNKHVRG